MPWNAGPTSRGIVARHAVESAQTEATGAHLKCLLAVALCEQGALSGCYPHEAVTAVYEQGTFRSAVGAERQVSDPGDRLSFESAEW
jgi:hypothetical protein